VRAAAPAQVVPSLRSQSRPRPPIATVTMAAQRKTEAERPVALTEHELARANATSRCGALRATAATPTTTMTVAATADPRSKLAEKMATTKTTPSGVAKYNDAAVLKNSRPVACAETPAPCRQVVQGDDVIGRWVLVTGLVRQPHFNGQWGLAEDFDAEMQRYIVRVLLGSEPGGASQPVVAKLRRENFVVVPASTSVKANPLPFGDEAGAAALRGKGSGDNGEEAMMSAANNPWRPSLRQLAPGRAGAGP
jgi:hypothetical protein